MLECMASLPAGAVSQFADERSTLCPLSLSVHLTFAILRQMQQVLFLDNTTDKKERTILTLKDIQKDLWCFYENHMHEHVAANHCQVALL